MNKACKMTCFPNTSQGYGMLIPAALVDWSMDIMIKQISAGAMH